MMNTISRIRAPNKERSHRDPRPARNTRDVKEGKLVDGKKRTHLFFAGIMNSYTFRLSAPSATLRIECYFEIHCLRRRGRTARTHMPDFHVDAHVKNELPVNLCKLFYSKKIFRVNDK